MTKRVNRLFLIVAVFFLVLSILIPIVDYYMTKAELMNKGQFTVVQDYIQAGTDMATQVGLDITTTYNFYGFFSEVYGKPNEQSLIYTAITNVKEGAFKKILTWNPITDDSVLYGETMFLFYILDKVLWLFVAYCIFVIPISMVDLFSKVIKKGVE